MMSDVVGGGVSLVDEWSVAKSPPPPAPAVFTHHMPPSHHATHNVFSTTAAAVPYFNMIPLAADNFAGPVNISVSPSVDPSGADLPINGK